MLIALIAGLLLAPTSLVLGASARPAASPPSPAAEIRGPSLSLSTPAPSAAASSPTSSRGAAASNDPLAALRALADRLPGYSTLAQLRQSAARSTVEPDLDGVSWGVSKTLDLTNGTLSSGNVLTSNCLYPLQSIYVPSSNDVLTSCYVSGQNASPSPGEILVTGASNGTLFRAIPTPEGATEEALITLHGTEDVAVLDALADNVTLINGTTDAVIGSLPTLQGPEAIAVDNATGEIFVADEQRDAVTILNASSRTVVVANISVGAQPDSLAFDPANGLLYVADSASAAISVIDVHLESVTATIPVGDEPSYLTLDAAAGEPAEVAFAAVGDGEVSWINASSNALAGNVSAPGPTAIAVDPSTGAIYVTNAPIGTVERIDPYSAAVSTTVLSSSTRIVYPYGASVDVASGQLVVQTDVIPVADGVATNEYLAFAFQVPLAGGAAGTPTASSNGIFNYFLGFPYQAAYVPAVPALFLPGSASESVAEFSLDAGEVTSTARVGTIPAGLVADPQSGELYALDGSPDELEVVNGTTGAIVTNVTMNGLLNSYVAVDPFQGSVLAGGGALGGVVEVGSANHTVFGEIPGLEPTASVADAQNGQIYAASEGTLVALNGATGNTIQSYPVGVSSGAQALALDPSAQLLFAAYGSGIDVLNTSIDELVGSIPLADEPVSLSFDPINGYLYAVVPSTSPGADSTVAMIHVATEAISNLTIGLNASSSVYDAIDHFIWFTNTGSDSLSVIDGANTLLASVAVPGSPEGIGVDPGTGDVFVGESNPSLITIVNGTTEAVVQNVPVGLGLAGAALDPVDDALVTMNELSGSLSFFNASSPLYRVTFQESGLSGTLWQVSLDGQVNSSTGSSISFLVPNGTFFYDLGASGERAAPATGNLTVAGGAASVSVVFTAETRYVVTFVESGLAAGTAWKVSLEGVNASSTGSSLSFSLPEGLYWYDDLNASGYTPTSPSGEVVVNGTGPRTIDLTFVELFAVSLVESGLPFATEWSAAVENNVSYQYSYNSSYSTTIGFDLPNGTYAIDYVYAEGYAGTTSVENFSVNGTSVIVGVTFLEAFDVTFTETGLPSGDLWGVELEPGNESAESVLTTDQFQVANGTYTYTVTSVPAGYRAQPSTGSVTVNGAAVGISIAFSLAPGDYLATFVESGLPQGTPWVVDLYPLLGGESYVFTTTTSATFAVTNDSYEFYIEVFVPDWVADPASGSFVISGSGVSESITFVPTYTLTFAETGLPAGSDWSVTVGGVPYFPSGTPFSVQEPNGTYAFSVAGPTGYTATPASGSVTVDGSATTVTIAFTVAPGYYPVTFVAADLPGGAGWYVTFNGNTSFATTGSIEFLAQNGTSYGFSVTPPSLYNALPASGLLDVAGTAVVEPIAFAPVPGAYNVTFTESGLPAGTDWIVSIVGGPSYNATGTTLEFPLTNGSYNYTVGSVNTSWATVGGGFQVQGGGVGISVPFIELTYAVVFSESGLPPPDEWEVTINGQNLSAAAPTDLTVDLPNGSYEFDVRGVVGYSANPSSGSVTVTGAATGVMIRFAPLPTQKVTFTESNLPVGTTWYVNVTGQPTVRSTTSSLSLPLPNGTYTYTVDSADKSYEASGGRFTVAGAPLGVPVTFVRLTYTVTISQATLPTGTTWYVNVTGGGSFSSTTGTLSFPESNGTYAYTVADALAHWYPAHELGSVVVSGGPASATLAFLEEFAIVVQRPSGTPSGASWSVSIELSNGVYTTVSATNGTITFLAPNGQYPYYVLVSGKGSYNSTGSVTVNSAPTTVTPAAVPSSSSLSPYLLYGAIAAAVVVLGGLAAYLLRRGRKPPTSTGPGAPPSATGSGPGGGSSPPGNP